MSNVQGKVWGNTKLLLANGVLEFHRIYAKQGGVCSKHKHAWKWNGFYVEEGALIIRIWQKDYDLCDETILQSGDFTTVKPGLYHQFEALENTIAFELYWAEFNHDDIIRETVGFDKEKKARELKDFEEYEKQHTMGKTYSTKHDTSLSPKEAELLYEQEIALKS